MTEPRPHGRRALLWIIIVVVVLGLVGLGIWFAAGSGNSDVSDNAQTSASTAGTTNPESSATITGLDPQCAGKVDPPADGAIEVVDKAVTIDDDETAFEFYLRQNTDLIAIQVTFAVQFKKDGEDVTNELKAQLSEYWDNPTANVFPDSLNENFEQSLETPDGWTQDNITLDVTVGSVEYWCTPKEAE